ncbi:hypothetical protein EVAR_78455_1 [Eumeta japonica]|uniref:Uncharacterized protein n=1 Tax=Eumeta variegata TaxID=151549 RepID=A0A4C1TY93_EUMVA|nr:hypothetical protein EVAR_78455_1 [Eumeta japonica]
MAGISELRVERPSRRARHGSQIRSASGWHDTSSAVVTRDVSRWPPEPPELGRGLTSPTSVFRSSVAIGVAGGTSSRPTVVSSIPRQSPRLVIFFLAVYDYSTSLDACLHDCLSQRGGSAPFRKAAAALIDVCQALTLSPFWTAGPGVRWCREETNVSKMADYILFHHKNLEL